MTLDLVLLLSGPTLLVGAIVILFRDTPRSFRLFGYVLTLALIVSVAGVVRSVLRAFDFGALNGQERVVVVLLAIVSLVSVWFMLFRIKEGNRARGASTSSNP